MRECVTHHYACDCREARFAQIEQENASLRAELQDVEAKLAETEQNNAKLHNQLKKIYKEAMGGLMAGAIKLIKAERKCECEKHYFCGIEECARCTPMEAINKRIDEFILLGNSMQAYLFNLPRQHWEDDGE